MWVQLSSLSTGTLCTAFRCPEENPASLSFEQSVALFAGQRG